MAGILIGGETFAQGELVTAERLNRHVNDGTIAPKAVTEPMLADGAIVSRHLNSSLGFTPGMIGIAAGTLLGGSAAGKGASLAINATEFEITTGPAPTLNLKAGGIAAGKLAGGILESQLVGGIPSAKLTQTIPGGPISVGSGIMVPVITFDTAGRATAVSQQPVALSTTSVNLPVPAAGAWTEAVTVPTSSHLGAWLLCVTATIGYVAGDRIPISQATSDSQAPGFVLRRAGNQVTVGRCAFANLSILDASNLNYSFGGSGNLVPANWNIQVVWTP